MKSKTESNALIGVAGVHYVVAELSRRGIIALPTIRNIKGVDIVASNPENFRTVNIQVKTCSKKAKTWVFSKKAENVDIENLVYVLVCLPERHPRDADTAEERLKKERQYMQWRDEFNPERQPEYYIVPSRVVAACIKRGRQEYLSKPSKNGRPRGETYPIRFSDKDIDLRDYRDRWELLKII